LTVGPRPGPRYFLDLPEDSSPRPWDPHAGARPERPDTRYFAAVFQEMERLLHDREIDVYLTWSSERLPAYGSRVVAVVLEDDGGRIPSYLGQVRAVFKCYGTSPALGTGPLRNPRLTGVLELAQYGVRWLRWLPGAAHHVRMLAGRRLRGQPAPPAVAVIPLGTFNQVDLPVVPIEERPTDLFFAGSVEHRASVRGLISPKAQARREMLAATRSLGRSRPELRVELRVTHSFEASAAASPLAYSKALMDARVCLAPRGTSVETFRVLQGLRAGCVVVTECLPRHPFYAGAPVVALESWRRLGERIAPVLDDPGELRRRHEQTLAWWQARCSERAVGVFLAERLNALATG
jgi:hypothetical protein